MSSRISDMREAAEAMHAAAIRLLRMVRVEDARAGVPPGQLSALSVLVFKGSASLGELASIEQVKPPTMSRIVQGLVERGLVARAARQGDRRWVRLSATPKGRKLLLAGRDRRVRLLSRRFGAFSPSELATVAEAARLLAQM